MEAILRSLTGGPPSPLLFELTHLATRKLAHVLEYALLALLLYRAVSSGGRTWTSRWGAMAFALSAAVAITDEALQSLSPVRTGSAADVLLDCVAAAVTLWVLYRVQSLRS